MGCSCRTAALRIFLKNIAQVNVPVRTTTPRLAHQTQVLHSQSSSFFNQRTSPLLRTASPRPLHTSCAGRSVAETAPASEGTSNQQHATASDPSSESTSGESHTVAEKPKRKSKAQARAEKDKRTAAEKEAEKAWKEKMAKKRPKYELEDEYDGSPKEKEPWMIQKEALKKKFPTGWNPRKKLSPDALVGIRMLHQQFPEEYTTEVLAKKFEVSAEAIRRILKSKWTPDPEEELERQERWFNRGKKVWTHWAALGKKPPRKWRAEGIVRDPVWNRPRGPTHKDPVARAEAQRRREAARKGEMYGYTE
ncbi:hypothetical protein VTI74DRAFT_7199 [Chaetomium olivicolor]